MTTWREMSLENRQAAQQLILADCYRSSISRSYYSAYCAVTGELSGKFTFGYGGNNPTHTDLPNLILHNLYSLSQTERWEVRKAVGDLWKQRVEADYSPAAYVDRVMAVNAYRTVNRILLILRIKE